MKNFKHCLTHSKDPKIHIKNYQNDYHYTYPQDIDIYKQMVKLIIHWFEIQWKKYLLQQHMYIKIVMIQLAWPLCKDDLQIYESFHIFKNTVKKPHNTKGEEERRH